MKYDYLSSEKCLSRVKGEEGKEEEKQCNLEFLFLVCKTRTKPGSFPAYRWKKNVFSMRHGGAARRFRCADMSCLRLVPPMQPPEAGESTRIGRHVPTGLSACHRPQSYHTLLPSAADLLQISHKQYAW